MMTLQVMGSFQRHRRPAELAQKDLCDQIRGPNDGCETRNACEKAPGVADFAGNLRLNFCLAPG